MKYFVRKEHDFILYEVSEQGDGKSKTNIKLIMLK